MIEQIAREIGDLPGGAGAWNALGDSRLAQGDAEPAILAYRRALAHRAPGDLHGRVLDARGLYRTYAMINDHESAMSNAALAYQWCRDLQDRELRGRVLVGVIALLYDIGDLPAAEAVIPETAGVVDPNTLVGLKLRELQALIQLAHGRAQIAVRELRDVQASARKQAPAMLAEATIDLVDAELDARDLDGAERSLAEFPAGERASGEAQEWYAHVAARVALERGHFADAISLTTEALHKAPPEWTGTLEGIRGRALWRLGQHERAEAALRAAITAIENRRAKTTLDTLKTWVIEQQRQPFEDLFQLYVEQGRVVDALEVVQRASSRSLLDAIARGPGAGGTVSQQIDHAGDRAAGMIALARSLSASRPLSPPSGSAVLATLSGRYVLTYFRAGASVWLIAVRPNAAPVARRIGGIEDTRDAVASWLADPDAAAASALANSLVPPDLRPARGATVYVAADEPVRDVAFAALRIDGEYLVERNPVAYLPSASAATAAESRNATPPIVIGDAAGDLPAARREALEIAKLLGVDASVGAQASRARLEAPGPRLLHVAGHSAMTSRGPALVVADGQVDSGEIIDRRVAPDVVVLTSCAAADPRERDELVPLAHAFLAAGTRAVVASRWSVEDEIALRFARAFYEAGGAKDPVAGTAAAQRQLIAEKLPARAWATFVVLEVLARQGANQ